MQNHVQRGEILTFVASATISGGSGVLLGSGGLFGVVSADVEAGEEGEAQITECFTLPKLSSGAPAAFDVAYWDDNNKRVTVDATDNTEIGYFMAGYAAGTTEANVRLCP